MNTERKTIAGIGEILWDLLPGGRQLGGAPANFAYQAHALGAATHVIAAVGHDRLGADILERLAALGLTTDCVSVTGQWLTGTVTVTVTADGQPHFVIHEQVAWDHLPLTTTAADVAACADAVCFGTLAQRSAVSRGTIRELVGRTREDALRVFDINLRQQFYSQEIVESSLAMANVLKINDEELPIVADMLGMTGGSRDQMASLARRFDLTLVALTRGSAGSLLYQDGRWSESRGRPTEVADTVGAGDAFTAAMTLGLLDGWDLDKISHWANELAAYVCTQPGATPPLPEELRSAFV